MYISVNFVGKYNTLGVQGGVRHRAAISKVFLAIGVTTSLIKRVALKGALTHSAHMVLHVEEAEHRMRNKK